MSPETTAPHPLTPTSVDELQEHVGRELGVSEWLMVTQADVDAFAAVTGDQQWIHTDPVRAATGPFGATIAHGYYTLSRAPLLLGDVLSLEGFPMAINYGLDKLRFPAPLPVGESVRLRVALARIDPLRTGATLTVELTFERSGGGKPVCVATALYRVVTHPGE
jgi:acyl dehydratase